MIVEIKNTFQAKALQSKLEYQTGKINAGVAKELYNSLGDINTIYGDMQSIARLNDRVKYPFVEFVVSLPGNENLSDEDFTALAKEWMSGMGYDDSGYTVIRNDDKQQPHIHILATTIDTFGKKISDKNNYRRSDIIARELEQKYGLSSPERKETGKKISLGEAHHRRYYVDAAIRKGLRSYKTKGKIEGMLSESRLYAALEDKSRPLTNDEWRIILGNDKLEEVTSFLQENQFFNPLLKDEILKVLDELYQGINSAQELRNALQERGYYMRLVSDKNTSYYVYGIPDLSFYIKDSAMPQKYRYLNMKFDGRKMNADEQKHYLYNQIFATLNSSRDYKDFKEKLASQKIRVVEHINNKGIYGISYSMTDVDNPAVFKASDISQRLTYSKIESYFEKNNQEHVYYNYVDEKGWVNNERNYMLGVLGNELFGGSSKYRERDDDGLPKRRRKKGMQQQR